MRPRRAHRTEKPRLSTLGAVREPWRVNVRPTRSSRNFYRVKVRWSTRISTPCAFVRRWGAWRELWERCWKPTRLCSIVFEAAQQAHHAAQVSQESRSYPTIGCVNAVCAGSTDLARPVDAETPDHPQPPKTQFSRGHAARGASVVTSDRAPRGATTATLEKIKKCLSLPQLDRTALSAGPHGLRYHRGEY